MSSFTLVQRWGGQWGGDGGGGRVPQPCPSVSPCGAGRRAGDKEGLASLPREHNDSVPQNKTSWRFLGWRGTAGLARSLPPRSPGWICYEGAAKTKALHGSLAGVTFLPRRLPLSSENNLRFMTPPVAFQPRVFTAEPGDGERQRRSRRLFRGRRSPSAPCGTASPALPATAPRRRTPRSPRFTALAPAGGGNHRSSVLNSQIKKITSSQKGISLNHKRQK